MANTQDNQNINQGNFTGFNPMVQWSGDDIKDIAQALRVLTSNPNALTSLGIGKQAPTESQSNYSENKWKFKEPEHSQPKYRSSGSLLGDFEAGIKEQLMDSLAGGSFKKGMQSALDTFAKEFGMDIRDLPREAGKQLTKHAFDAFKNSDTGKKLKDQVNKYGNQALDRIFKNVQGGDQIKGSIKKVAQNFLKGGQGQGSSGIVGKMPRGGNGNSPLNTILNSTQGGNKGQFLSNILKSGGQGGTGGANALSNLFAQGGGKLGSLLSKGGGALGKVGGVIAKSGAGKAMAGLAAKGMGALASAGPYGIIIAAVAVVAAKIIKKIFGPLISGLTSMIKALGKSFNREEEIRKKRLEEAKQRIKDDISYITEEPYKILKDSVEKWTSVWDSNLRKVGQTQGYDKESVYALYESYAEKLRSEGLGSVINATDIVEKLSSVLDSGLSGKAAEEFAYMATKLGAAIPTQDFFSYADTYASLAANAIAQGKSQSEALDYANSQLEDFASNLLYSSRELAGGFSTGLKNSSQLFKDAAQIAQSAKTTNAAEISGTLTSVSAIIGAVAPDLADSLVNNIVQSAIGGNSDTIVALRSLSGIGASNTEFLQALAKDPKSVFVDMFRSLADLQNMSPDNYMESAENLSNIFGIDKAAFARVDFNYLATAIKAMNTNSSSLEDNLELLASGETTTTAEQLKAQEINKVILDEGLAYVIDSEAGRAIQEHMWNEQMKVELEENTYSVDLQGSALEFLEGIRKTVTNLLNFLNPIGAISKGIANMTKTVAESIDNDQDIKEILQLGAVGRNSQALSNLTTRGKDLNLTSSLVEMMGGQKGTALGNFLTASTRLVSLSTGGADTYNYLHDKGLVATGAVETGLALTKAAETISSAFGGGTSVAINSRYSWGTVGKSIAKAVQSTPMNTNTMSAVVRQTTNATQFAQEQSNKKFEQFLATAKDAVSNKDAQGNDKKSLSYDEWVATAKDMGISDFSAALEAYGRSEQELKDFFETNETAAGAAVEEGRKKDEELFRKETREYWGFTSNGSGIYQTALWFPFFGEGQKYDTRMDAVDTALSVIQGRIGLNEEHTVIGGIEELSRKIGVDTEFTVISVLENINNNIQTTFVSTSSYFQRCLADWIRYMAESAKYTESLGGSKTKAWYDLESATANNQQQATLALANALGVFTSEQLKNMDPQLQANVLLGEIVVILQKIMQQNNTQAGGLSLIDTISALGLGATKK